MKSIEYLINEDNLEITLDNILNDWALNNSEQEDANKLSDTDKLSLLLFIEEKSKMVYLNLGESAFSESNIDLYTNICLQPQNLLYTALPFHKNLSITISMNEIKAFVAEIAFTLLTVQEIDLEQVKIIIIKLLVLLITCSKIISDDIEKDVLKAILTISKNEPVTKKEILDFFSEEQVCPNVLQKCKYYDHEKDKCKLNKKTRNKKIDKGLKNLVENKVITIINQEENEINHKYCISNFIKK